MTHHPRPYRRGFVRAALAEAPADARDWLAQLEQVVDELIRPHAAQVDLEGRYPHESVEALAKIGAFGVVAPRDAGGLGYDAGVACLALETIASGCASSAAILMFHLQVLRRTMLYGNDKQRREHLPRLASGEWLGASAWSESQAGSDKRSFQTRLVRRAGPGSAWQASGVKWFCTGLEGASLLHVLLGVDEGQDKLAPTFVSLRRDAPGVDVGDIEDLLGLRGSSTGRVRLDRVELDNDDIVGVIGGGPDMMLANHRTCIHPGVLALGVARAAFEQVKLQASGGIPGIRSTLNFQNTRFVLADIELQLGSTYAYAAQLVEDARAGVPDLHVDCMKLKARASEMACTVTRQAVGLAGARGFSRKWPYERLMRDAQATVLMGPTNEIIRERIAGQIKAEHAETPPPAKDSDDQRRDQLEQRYAAREVG